MTQLSEVARAACKRLSVLIVGGEPAARSALRTGLARQVGLVDSAGSDRCARDGPAPDQRSATWSVSA